MRLIKLCWISFMLCVLPLSAQEGLNLPTELYILLNEGVVERYGLGISGVQQVTPADEFVLDFQVAPDGNWIAYRTENGLFMANMYQPETLRQIEGASASIPLVRGRGETVAWSPAGDVLAYTTENGGRVYLADLDTFVDLGTAGIFNLMWSPEGRYLAAEAEEGVWWIFRRELNNLALTSAIPGSQGATWLNDTQIIFAAPEGGLIGMDLTNANQQIPLLDGSTIYHHPKTLPDGRLHVFQGNEVTEATLLQVTLNANGAQSADISAGVVDLTGVQWAPGGNLLTAFQGGALALIDPVSGGGFTLPISSAAAYSWGPLYPPSAAGIQLPTDGYFLALDNSGIQQVWRLPANGTLPVTITPATSSISEYALSPDETRVAYVSNRRLWLYILGSESSPLELLTLSEINNPIQPAFSPDGSTIYFQDLQGIQRIPATGGEVNPFATSAVSVYENPLPANGLNAVALIETLDDRRSISVLDGETGTALVTYTVQSVAGSPSAPFWLEGSTLGFIGTLRETLVDGVPMSGGVVTDTPGLYLADVSNPTQAPTLLFSLLNDIRLLDVIALDAVTLRGLVQQGAPAAIQILDIPRSGETPVIVGNAGYMVNPQLAPDGNAVIGSTAPDGGLLTYELMTQIRTLLDTLPQVVHFRWSQQ